MNIISITGRFIIFMTFLMSSFASANEYPNGTCVRHKWDQSIAYAIAGKTDSRYDLIVMKDGLPISMLMGNPLHSSIIFINRMFEVVACNWKSGAIGVEIYDDFYDPYREEKRYSAKMF